jgi:short-subunit dehydrogenase
MTGQDHSTMALPSPDSNSTVVVTGASSGIGAELARQLARRGYGVTLVARRAEKLHELAKEIEADYGVPAGVETADLQEREGRDALADKLLAGTVIGLVNNAGYGDTGPFVKADLDWHQGMVQLNCQALLHLTGRFLPAMVERGSGAVLNLASLAACQPVPNMATYAATKAFVLSFSEALHTEVRAKGVSVTAVQPGPVKTEFWELANERGKQPDAAFLPAEQVAGQAIQGMIEGRRTVVPSLKWKSAAVAGRFVPRTVQLPLMKRFGY